MGIVRDALTALITPSVRGAVQPLVDRVVALESAIGALQVPADLADRLAALEGRPIYDPQVNVAIDDAIGELSTRIGALEARPVLSDEDRLTLGQAREVRAELEEIAAGVQSTPA